MFKAHQRYISICTENLLIKCQLVQIRFPCTTQSSSVKSSVCVSVYCVCLCTAAVKRAATQYYVCMADDYKCHKYGQWHVVKCVRRSVALSQRCDYDIVNVSLNLYIVYPVTFRLEWMRANTIPQLYWNRKIYIHQAEANRPKCTIFVVVKSGASDLKRM